MPLGETISVCGSVLEVLYVSVLKPYSTLISSLSSTIDLDVPRVGKTMCDSHTRADLVVAVAVV